MSGYRLRVVLVGWGAIATRVADLLAQRGSAVEIAAVAVRDASVPRKGLPEGARLIAAPEDLADLKADLLVEAAGRAAVPPWAAAGLRFGWDVALSSTSALTDAAVLAQLTALAAQLGLTEVRHEIVKPALAWRGTAAETLCDLAALTAPFTFFEGTARAAADAYPHNANSAVISALAGLGLDHTTLALTADPDARLNAHRIHAVGDFGTLTMVLENRPLATNPKSSEMTALSLLRLIENRTSQVVI